MARRKKGDTGPAEGHGKRLTVTMPQNSYKGFERLAELLGDGASATTIANRVLVEHIEDAIKNGLLSLSDLEGLSKAALEEQLRTLIGFLNCLIDTRDHDGYSLAVIAKILGRPDDGDLADLIDSLQKPSRDPHKAHKP